VERSGTTKLPLAVEYRFNMKLANMLGTSAMPYAVLTANPEPEEVF